MDKIYPEFHHVRVVCKNLYIEKKDKSFFPIWLLEFLGFEYTNKYYIRVSSNRAVFLIEIDKDSYIKFDDNEDLEFFIIENDDKFEEFKYIINDTLFNSLVNIKGIRKIA